MKFWTKEGLIKMTVLNSNYLRNHQELGSEKDLVEVSCLIKMTVLNSNYLRNHQELGSEKDLVEVSYDVFKDIIKMVEVLETKVELNWLFNVTINDISVIHVTAHRCAGGLKKKLDLRSGSQRHRHFVGFFNVPVLAPTRDQPFYTVIPTHRPI